MIEWIAAYRWALARLFAALIIGATGILITCQACTPAEVQTAKQDLATVANDATGLEPFVFGVCGFTEVAVDTVDPPLAGAVDLVCSTIESADKSVASLSTLGVQAKIVRTEVAPNDGGGLVKRYRIRCYGLPVALHDAGGG